MPDSKLMSYITSDFQSQSDLKVGQMEWEKIMEEKFQKFIMKEEYFKGYSIILILSEWRLKNARFKINELYN